MDNTKSKNQKVRGLVLISAAGFAIYWLLIRSWHQKWGTTDQAAAYSLPGDELIPDAPWRTAPCNHHPRSHRDSMVLDCPDGPGTRRGLQP